MSLEFLTDLDFPVLRRRVVAEKVAEYVDVTGDDPDRWTAVAPPSYAGALLFAAAPQLLAHHDVARYTTVLVHLDQTFRWHDALPVDDHVELTGRVTRVRSRGGAYFVTYAMDVMAGGEVAIESVSTFLLGEEAAGAVPAARPEPAIREAANSETPTRYGAADGVPALAKSASRHDLVRYAAASGDFNPIHFDHDAARAAGLEGVVGHGLLTTAWVTQLAAAASGQPAPLAELTVRYRDPMYPGDQVTVSGEARDPQEGLRRLDINVAAGERTAITGRVLVREA